jgi:IS1 family transposase
MHCFYTKNLWPFPPNTQEVQLDEKWSFVYKKQANCQEGDCIHGDQWDHVAYDPENKLVLSVVPGKRTLENTSTLVAQMKKIMQDRMPSLIASDEYKPYKTALLEHYGKVFQPERKGKVGRKPNPIKIPPKGLNYVVVHKERENGRMIKITPKIIFGDPVEIAEKLAHSSVSRCINTAFIERYNATNRHQDARKARDTYEFSKALHAHQAMTYFINYTYNFCWAVRTLRIKNEAGTYCQRTPAMAAGLTDHIWSLEEWLSYPCVHL